MGLFQDTCEPRYFTESAMGAGSQFEKWICPSSSLGCLNSSVSDRLRSSPYRDASTCRCFKYSSTTWVLMPNKKVSSAYSRSYTGFPTDQVFVGIPCFKSLSSTSESMAERTITNRQGLRGLPCLIPV